jgi:hypothetical protein
VSTIALVVPSYQRSDQLADCLAHVGAQARRFDDVVVVMRTGDEATRRVAAAAGVRVVAIDAPGVVAAMCAGAAATSSDIIGFTDDDARLSTSWSADVLAAFVAGGDAVGAVGGRDEIFDGDVARATTLTEDVGRITWWGRVIGNHHRGRGPARPVVALKGVNCAYRRDRLGLPTSLRGEGAQAHFELSVGRFVRERGSQLIYDPAIRVEHRPAARRGEDQRTDPSATAVADSAFNLMRALAPNQQSRRWLYVHLAGDRACPGVLRCLVAVLARDRSILARRAASWRGTTDAWRVRRVPVSFATFS